MDSEKNIVLKIKGEFIYTYLIAVIGFGLTVIAFTQTESNTIIVVLSALILTIIYVLTRLYDSHTIVFTSKELIVKNMLFQSEMTYKLNEIKEVGVHKGSYTIRVESKIYGVKSFSENDLQKVVDHCKQFRFILITDLPLIDR